EFRRVLFRSTHAERLLVQLSFYRRSIVSVPFYARGEHIRTLGFRTLTILLNIDHPHGEIGIIRFGNFSKTAFKKRFLEGSPLAAYHLKLRHSQHHRLFEISKIGPHKPDRFKSGNASICLLRLPDRNPE